MAKKKSDPKDKLKEFRKRLEFNVNHMHFVKEQFDEAYHRLQNQMLVVQQVIGEIDEEVNHGS